jgi:hypothetical protein
MMKIDVKRRDVGKIVPAWHPDEFDRPAHYQFKDKFFDAHGREIVPGEPLQEEDMADEDAEGEDDGHAGLSPAALIGQANTMPWSRFKALAQELLGPTCPKAKPGIVARLQALVEGRQTKVTTVSRKGVAITEAAPKDAPQEAPKAGGKPKNGGGAKSWPAAPKEKPAPAAEAAEASTPPTAPAAKASPAAQPGVVDLAAWGRGEVDYLNGPLAKAAKAELKVPLTERREILDALIDNGVIEADEARTDL